jgi:hypothetical protein
VLRRLWRAVGAAWLVTGPILNARVKPRRVPLQGRRHGDKALPRFTTMCSDGRFPLP